MCTCVRCACVGMLPYTCIPHAWPGSHVIHVTWGQGSKSSTEYNLFYTPFPCHHWHIVHSGNIVFFFLVFFFLRWYNHKCIKRISILIPYNNCHIQFWTLKFHCSTCKVFVNFKEQNVSWPRTFLFKIQSWVFSQCHNSRTTGTPF